MKLSRLILPLTALAALAACDDEAYRDATEPSAPPPLETAPPEVAPETPPVEPTPDPVVETTQEPPRSSDESVQPESETLFY